MFSVVIVGTCFCFYCFWVTRQGWWNFPETYCQAAKNNNDIQQKALTNNNNPQTNSLPCGNPKRAIQLRRPCGVPRSTLGPCSEKPRGNPCKEAPFLGPQIAQSK